jgi:hypothetical protein
MSNNLYTYADVLANIEKELKSSKLIQIEQHKEVLFKYWLNEQIIFWYWK